MRYLRIVRFLCALPIIKLNPQIDAAHVVHQTNQRNRNSTQQHEQQQGGFAAFFADKYIINATICCNMLDGEIVCVKAA